MKRVKLCGRTDCRSNQRKSIRTNKIERIDTVLAGHEPDRPPVSLWYQFGLQHGGGAAVFRASLEFFDHYDFDFLKVMNDAFYPAPDGVDTIRTPEDPARFRRFKPTDTIWRESLQRGSAGIFLSIAAGD